MPSKTIRTIRLVVVFAYCLNPPLLNLAKAFQREKESGSLIYSTSMNIVSIRPS